MQSTCCGCLRKLTDLDQKNIFGDEKVTVNLLPCDEVDISELPESSEHIELYRGIELITGLKITGTSKRSLCLCEYCFQKVESFLNFRSRLISSLQTVTDSSILSAACNSDNTENSEIITRKPTVKLNAIPPEVVINVDENSTPLEFVGNSTIDDEADSTDSIDSIGSPIDQKNNNLNDSECSEDQSVYFTVKEILLKTDRQETDIESEIDVCSGEDDEVLELDSQARISETVEISSSESDIEVCDYEPAGKRIKNLSALSLPVLF